RALLWSLAIFLVGWTLVHLPLASITQSISMLGWQQWCAWFGINAFIVGLGNQRWHNFISVLKTKISFTDLLYIRQAGQAVSFITPGPQFGGEPLQLYWLCKKGLPFEKAVLSIGLDRFYEVCINFIVLIICVLILLTIHDDLFTNTLFTPSYQSIGGFILALAIMIASVLLAHRRYAGILKPVQYLLSNWLMHPKLQKIKNSWRSVKEDLAVLWRTRKSVFLSSAVVSLAVWAALLGELALLLNFLNVEVDLSAFLLILIAMRLALLLPIPGGVGTLEASIFWSFQYLNFSTTAAIALIALMRLRDLVILLLGLYCLRRVGTKPSIVDSSLSVES
ncbi:MAG: lysylphosphatidylglycerol synthase transmembrane domain-containing protein, partial [Cellvibrio sp.]